MLGCRPGIACNSLSPVACAGNTPTEGYTHSFTADASTSLGDQITAPESHQVSGCRILNHSSTRYRLNVMFFRSNKRIEQVQQQVTPHPLIAKSKSFWVILGYLFWIGFYIGAMIMREVTK
jgi:hypothetical protein